VSGRSRGHADATKGAEAAGRGPRVGEDGPGSAAPAWSRRAAGSWCAAALHSSETSGA